MTAENRSNKRETNYPPKEFYFGEPRSREIWSICYGMIPDMLTVLSSTDDKNIQLANKRLDTYKSLLHQLGIVPNLHKQPTLNENLGFWIDWGEIATAECAACRLLQISEDLPKYVDIKLVMSEFCVSAPDVEAMLVNAILFNLPKPLQRWTEDCVFTIMTARLLGIPLSELQAKPTC